MINDAAYGNWLGKITQHRQLVLKSDAASENCMTEKQGNERSVAASLTRWAVMLFIRNALN